MSLLPKKCSVCGDILQWCKGVNGYFLRCATEYSHPRLSVNQSDMYHYEQFSPNRDESEAEWAREKIDLMDD